MGKGNKRVAVFKCKMCGGYLNCKETDTVVTCEYCGVKQTVPTLDDKKEQIVYVDNKNIQALLDRGNMALEDKEWEKAEKYFEQVLNLDAHSGEAYLGKFLREYHCENLEKWKEFALNRYDCDHTQKLMAYHKGEVQKDINRIAQKYVIPNFLSFNIEGQFNNSYNSVLESRKCNYKNLCNYLENSQNLNKARRFLEGTKKSSVEKVIESVKKTLQEKIDSAEKQDQASIENIKKQYQEHLNKCEENCMKEYEKANRQREKKYQEACKKINREENLANYVDSKIRFERLTDYKDATTYVKKFKDKIKIAKRKRSIKTTIFVIIGFILFYVLVFANAAHQTSVTYNEAMQLLENQEYDKALELFTSLNNYKDSREKEKYIKDILNNK